MELSTIQKHDKLNKVVTVGAKGPGGAFHCYEIKRLDAREIDGDNMLIACINLQEGPRTVEDSKHGIIDTDLLEIVRHRLQCFQSGDFSSRENAIALTCVEEALMWLNKRVSDRAEKGILGTNNK